MCADVKVVAILRGLKADYKKVGASRLDASTQKTEQKLKKLKKIKSVS